MIGHCALSPAYVARVALPCMCDLTLSMWGFPKIFDKEGSGGKDEVAVSMRLCLV